MEITYDLEKSAKNVLERDLPFSEVAHLIGIQQLLKKISVKIILNKDS